MSPKPLDVTDAELSVLSYLWDHGPSATRAIAAALYPEKQRTPSATVLKLLERLEAKGFVRRDNSGPVQIFHPEVDRDGLIDRRLTAVADDLCGGAKGPLLMHLVGGRTDFTAEEIGMLRRLIDELDVGAGDPAGTEPD